MPHMPACPTLAQLLASHAPFALLDDAQATAGPARSRLLHDFVGQLRCTANDSLDIWQQQVQAALDAGMHALLLADYQWGLHLQGLASPADEHGPAPALRALLFARQHRLDGDQVDAWLADAAARPAGLLHWQPGHDQARFTRSIEQIQAAIRRGDTYQVNHTFPLHGLAHGCPASLYARLRQRQRAPYAALIHLPQGEWVLSLSPELFVRVENGRISAAPMKGTVAAGDDPAAAAQWLRSDAKNRAENLMIVDLLRNDLAQVALPGSVQVPALFDVQHTGRVLGMTSTVRAQLQPGADLAALLRAVFPCGSITGAPKRSTMALIQQLETAAPAPHQRGLYTGAIGWLDGGTDAARMQLCLSVPIRTIELRPHADGGFHARLPVGAGITIDSDAAAEWAECQLKADFARHDMAGLELIETLRVEAGQAALWPQHRARLCASAAQLGLPLDTAQLDTALAAQLAALDPARTWRLRLALAADGQLHCRSAVLPALPGNGPVQVLLADTPVTTPTWLLGHKTSLRQAYDAAVARAEAAGAFDMLFFDADGWLTEGARSNVFVQLDGHWFTPPANGKLLPGVMRAQLLADSRLGARQRPIHRDELAKASQLLLCNALRGAIPAVLAATTA